MPGQYWKQVHASGLEVPSDRPLDDLTAELTRMLGDTDPEARDGTAYPTLATWVERGVYDDLLSGLGDGMAAGLGVGLGERDTDSVFRRSFSALVLGECIGRDNQRPLVVGSKVLEWGDRVATWLLRERDLRGFVPGKGWAHAVAHGADALGTLAELAARQHRRADRDPRRDRRPAAAAGRPALHQRRARPARRGDDEGAAPQRARRCGSSSRGSPGSSPAPRPASYDDRDPHLVSGNAEAFLRALHLQLALGPRPPEVRSDLLLVVVDALRTTNPHYLQARELT